MNPNNRLQILNHFFLIILIVIFYLYSFTMWMLFMDITDVFSLIVSFLLFALYCHYYFHFHSLIVQTNKHRTNQCEEVLEFLWMPYTITTDIEQLNVKILDRIINYKLCCHTKETIYEQFELF